MEKGTILIEASWVSSNFGWFKIRRVASPFNFRKASSSSIHSIGKPNQKKKKKRADAFGDDINALLAGRQTGLLGGGGEERMKGVAAASLYLSAHSRPSSNGYHWQQGAAADGAMPCATTIKRKKEKTAEFLGIDKSWFCCGAEDCRGVSPRTLGAIYSIST